MSKRGLLSALGMIGAGVAAPFTGGTSLAALPAILGAVGQVAGGAAKGSADQRITENQQRLQSTQAANSDALQRANLYLNAASQGANLDLARKQFQQNEPSVQARQALVGNLLQRLQPVSLSGLSDRVHLPHMNSILDALGPEARQAGALLAQRGVSGLESGPTQFAPFQMPTLPAYQQPDIQKSGMLEKILGTVGLIGSGAGAIGAGMNASNGGGDASFNNAIPSAYSGLDRYGNPINFALNRPDLNPNLDATYFGAGG